MRQDDENVIAHFESSAICNKSMLNIYIYFSMKNNIFILFLLGKLYNTIPYSFIYHNLTSYYIYRGNTLK